MITYGKVAFVFWKFKPKIVCNLAYSYSTLCYFQLYLLASWISSSLSFLILMFISVTIPFNSLRPRQIGRQLPEDTFKRIKFNKNVGIVTELHWRCSQGSNWQYGIIRSGNDLAPNRRQTIIWNNGALVYQRMYGSRSLNELNSKKWNTCHLLNRFFVEFGYTATFTLINGYIHWQETVLRRYQIQISITSTIY